MKKLLALVMALIMLLSSAAVAEEIVYEQFFDGTWVQFEDGFEIYLPSEWLELEVTDEMLEGGIFYAVMSPDGAYTCQMIWSALDAEYTYEEALAEVDAIYPGAELLEVNGIGLICFADAENDILGFAALDGAEPGLYMFFFTPMADENLQLLASVIASSLRLIEE